MCGIAGVIAKKPLTRDAMQSFGERLQGALAHRGPDGAGMHISENAVFVHTRLAIVDRAAGAQPMYSADKAKGIVFNGEVYNHGELRQELESAGAKFDTHCDTEVILRGFEVWGAQVFERLHGMFAVCVWDEQTGAVHLARDRFGQKPLLIYEDEQYIVFSSEMRALLSLAEVQVTPSLAGLFDYLTFRYVQAPYTVFEQIRKLPAGYAAFFDKGGRRRLSPFATLSYPGTFDDRFEAGADPQEVVRMIGEQLHQSVKRQLMGEVPIGVLLSGGLDSSCIATMVRDCGARLTTFNIGFPEVNEFEYSRAVATALDLPHVEVTMQVAELVESLPAVIAAIDEPIADPATLPLYRLCTELKKQVTVVFSGEGGDEIFGGYPQYVKLLQAEGGVVDPASFQGFFENSFYFADAARFLMRDFVSPVWRRNQKYFMAQSRPLEAALSYDMHTWMPENLMMKADKVLMAHGLEGRFPFLDERLFEYVAQLPSAMKIHPTGVTKWALKELMRSKFPTSVVDRSKMGFTTPQSEILRQSRELVYDALHTAERGVLAGVLQLDRVRGLLDGFYAGNQDLTWRAWLLFVLMQWFNTCTVNRLRR